MGINWKSALSRTVGEFFSTELSGIASFADAVVRFDPEKGREIMTVKFLAKGEHWKLKIETSTERPPLGQITIEPGPPGLISWSGPIDVVTWTAIGAIIKSTENNANAA